MRNLTRNAIVIEHPTGQRKLVERSEPQLEHPDLYEQQETAVRVNPSQHAVPVCRRRQCPVDERQRFNAELRRPCARLGVTLGIERDLSANHHYSTIIISSVEDSDSAA